jgi:hypothetical protein
MGEPLDDARDLVREWFPQARWAILAGSVLSSARTTGSDLDIVVLVPEGDPEAQHRESLRFRDWPVELFVNDERSLRHYLDKDLADRRPTLHRMVATGVPAVGEPAAIQQHCADVLAAGPKPRSEAERAWLRYALTDLIDDYVHANDDGECATLESVLWIAAAQNALSFADHWIGVGKWMLRELRDLDPDLASRWLAARTDPLPFATEVLDRAGGPLFEGYRVAAETPS